MFDMKISILLSVIHESCPLCRYNMDVKEKQIFKKDADDCVVQLGGFENKNQYDGGIKQHESMVVHIFFFVQRMV